MKLEYGMKKQVKFDSLEEKEEAIEYLLSDNDNFFYVIENNQEQGAWGREYRICFYTEHGVPQSLLRNMTAGVGNVFGRINCKELIDELIIRGLVLNI